MTRRGGRARAIAPALGAAVLAGALWWRELFGDPHCVRPKRLRERAESAALTFARRSGSPLGYFALFLRPDLAS